MANFLHPVRRRPAPSLKPVYEPKTDWAGNLIPALGDDGFFRGCAELAYQSSWRACTWAGISAPMLERDPEIIGDMVKYLRSMAQNCETAQLLLDRIARQGLPETHG